jgi:Putative adhesin
MGPLMPTFDTPQPISATVDVVSGDVRVTASERDTTVVEVRPTDAANDEDVRAAERTRVEFTGGHLIVKTPKLRSWLPGTRGGSIDVTVELPAGSKLHGAGQLADFQATGALGDVIINNGLGRAEVEDADTLRMKIGMGDIVVGRARGHADIRAGSGEARFQLLEGSAVVKNSNGDTWIGEVRGDLRVHAANGSITVEVADASVVAKSANGGVRLGDVARGSVVLETAIGDLEVGIREGSAAWLDVRATAGRVHNTLEAGDGPGDSSETVEVRARTTAGNVAIGRPS